MTLAPAVIVHGLADARVAVGAGRPVTLLSAVGAASFTGVGWWQALVRAAAEGAEVRDILDCGWSAGRVLEALGARQKLLVLRAADARVWRDLAERAEDCGAVLLGAAPDALDMGQRGAERRLVAWLQAGDFDGRIV